MKTKSDFIKLWGGKHKPLYEALGITRQAFGKWPEELSIKRQDRLVGLSLRLGYEIDKTEL